MVSTPKPPDPVKTAQAQAQMNKETAVAQKGLGSDNVYTPDGSSTFNEIGTWSDGTPRFEQRVSLSPEQQRIYDLGNQNEVKLGTLAGSQLDRLGTLLGRPVDLSNEATEARLMELGRKRLDPLWRERNDALETNLLNRGIRPGSDAYATTHRISGEQENDAYNQLLLAGRQQAINEALTERNQPINEITALMSGSQVSQPGVQQTAAPGVAPVDYTGLVSNNYAQQVAAANAKWGALGSLAGAVGTAAGGWLRGRG